MISLGLIWLFFQQLIIELLLLLLEVIDTSDSLPLGYLQIGVLLLDSQQFLKAISKVALVLEINFYKVIKCLQTKEHGNFLESSLSDGQELIENFLDFLDKVDFRVLTVI